MAEISELYAGCVVKMNPTQHSHVTLPYYAKVLFVRGSEFMLTVPGQHDLMVSLANRNIQYQLDRMEIMGSTENFGHLLRNQTFE